jgi:hypothetical protein
MSFFSKLKESAFVKSILKVFIKEYEAKNDNELTHEVADIVEEELDRKD